MPHSKSMTIPYYTLINIGLTVYLIQLSVPWITMPIVLQELK